MGDFAVTGWGRGGGCLFCVFLVSDTGIGGVGLGFFSEIPFPGSSGSSGLYPADIQRGLSGALSAVVYGIVWERRLSLERLSQA